MKPTNVQTLRRTWLVLAMCLLAAVAASAQHYPRHTYRHRLPTPPPPGRVADGYSRSTPTVRSASDAYVGLRLGLSVATVNSDNRYLDGGKAKTGLNAGVVAGVQLAPATPLCIETGLLYTEKGGKGNNNGTFTYALNYLEMPLVMKYGIDLGPLCSVQPFVGVYGAVGVSGKIKNFGERKAYSAFDDDAFRRLDGGLRMGCGLQLGYAYAELGYDLGLANVTHDYFDTGHTGSFFANVGVNF